ncbi:MAG: NAD(P)-binding domain-containing protein, partial [Acidobacteria bacterium]|nr:NAD(P)-binding domain-containing protein [Acidobacteriota bacterium]
MITQNPLGEVRLSFVGSGVMAEAMLAGLLRKGLVAPEQITGSHPREARREELREKYSIRTVESNREAASGGHIVILAVKPQRLGGVLHELEGAFQPEQLVLSIVAGAKIETIAGELKHPAIVRAMPNTPAQIGAGMIAWTATAEVTEAQQAQVRAMLAALGREMYVEHERMIDMATALSATGPTYIFM